MRKNVLTTGDVAKLCNVAPRTVSKWFDTGQLRGYRIPGSKDRRIPLDQLIRFMRAHSIPLDGLDNGWTRVLILDGDAAFCDAIQSTLGENREFEVATAQSALEAGAAAQEFKPDVLVVDVTLADVSVAAASRFVRSLSTTAPVSLIGIGQGLTDAQGQALLQQGFDGYLAKPFDTSSLVRLIDEHAGAHASVGSV